MDKLNYRVGSTPILHNGQPLQVGEPVALTAEEAKSLQGHVTLDPVQVEPPAPAPAPAPAEPPVQPAAAESAAPVISAAAPAAEAPKADAKGKSVKSGEKA